MVCGSTYGLKPFSWSLNNLFPSLLHKVTENLSQNNLLKTFFSSVAVLLCLSIKKMQIYLNSDLKFSLRCDSLSNIIKCYKG